MNIMTMKLTPHHCNTRKMTNVFNTLLLALCIADLLVIAANLPLAISVHTQLDMFRSAMQSTVFRV